MRVLQHIVLTGLVLTAVASTGCQRANPHATPDDTHRTGAPSAGVAGAAPVGLPGMPPHVDPSNVYAAAGAGMLAEHVRGHRELVYVPHTNTDDVWVIDPTTFAVVDRFAGGPEPQHVVPSYDLRTLYVTADRVPVGSLTPVDPATGKPGQAIEVQDVYNLYFTPDGQYGLVVAEYYQRLDFYDPRTWQRQHSLHLPQCEGVNHMDFSADGRVALIACEFANRMVAVDVAGRTVLRAFDLDRVPDGMPQDTRLAPDGSVFYVADMMAGGVYFFDGQATAKLGFVPTGHGAHGIYFSRDAKRMFVTNRGEGSVTVLDPVTRETLATWHIPGGGSPDMGALSPDGSQLWLAGRYHDEVYVLSTVDGRLLARVKVHSGPHGLLYWPQPGRYSLGHTTNIR